MIATISARVCLLSDHPMIPPSLFATFLRSLMTPREAVLAMPGEFRHSDIAAACAMDSACAAALLSRMRDQGLLKRRGISGNGRAQFVYWVGK